MLRYKVRPAGIADAKYVYKMNVRLNGTSLTETQSKGIFRDIIIDADQTILLIIHSGNAVGYIHARQVNNLIDARHTEIVSFAVYEYYRERNALRELVNAVEQWSRQMLSLFVRSDRIELKEFGYHVTAHGRVEKIYSEADKTIFPASLRHAHQVGDKCYKRVLTAFPI